MFRKLPKTIPYFVRFSGMEYRHQYGKAFSFVRHLKENRATHLLLVLLALFFAAIATTRADNKGDEIVAKMRGNLDKLNTFEADIRIVIDVSYLDMPPKTGKIYYQSPGRSKIDIPGFSLLPKEGTGLFLDEVLGSGDVSAIYVGEEKLKGKPHHVLKVLPLDQSSNIVLTTLWVDAKNYTVTKAEATTKNSGSLNMAFEYTNVKGINLPKQMEIGFQVEEFKLPKTMTGDTRRGDDKPAENNGRGGVKISYSNYKVNIPLPKGVFD